MIGQLKGLLCSLALYGLVCLVSCKPAPTDTNSLPPSSEAEKAASSEATEEQAVVESIPTPSPPPAPAILATAPELKVKKSAQVAILGYHDFTTGKSSNPMVINVSKFRQQMQSIQEARLKVISMADYLAWRKGERDLPGDPCLMITIDDGWKSVHTLALPVLKEFGFPFTVFLYKNFVNGGGRALNTAEIQEIVSNGGTIGSHSVSHPFPAEFKRRAKSPAEEYAAFVFKEFTESKAFLEQLLGKPVTTFAYPGGYYTPEMAEKGAKEWGYEALFTCNPVRTTWDTPMAEIGRFIVYGNDANDRNFRAATSFGGDGSMDLGRQLLGGEIGEDGSPQAPLVVVNPPENATVSERRPEISIDLSKLGAIDPASIQMRLPGFGQVPCQFNSQTKVITWKPVAILRSAEVAVHVRFRRQGEPKDDMVSWKFFIDQLPHYLPPPSELPAADTKNEDTVK